MQMRALKRLRTGGHITEIGEVFTVRSSSMAKALKALGRAEAFTEEDALVQRVPEQVKALEPEPVKKAETPPGETPPDEEQPLAEKPSARYRRRDMVAEETP